MKDLSSLSASKISAGALDKFNVVKHILIKITILFLLLFPAACSPRRNFFLHPRLQAEPAPVKKVAVLPAAVKIECENLQGKVDCTGMEEDVARLLEGVLAEVSEDYGFRPVMMTGATAAAWPAEWEEDYEELMGAFEAASPPRPDNPGSLGLASSRLAWAGGTDGLLVSRAGGEVHSAGRQTLALTADLLLGVLSQMACIFNRYTFCFYTYPYFYSETENYLLYEAAVADGADGTMLLRLWGQVSLTEFGFALPGSEHYPEALDHLRVELGKQISARFEDAFASR